MCILSGGSACAFVKVASHCVTGHRNKRGLEDSAPKPEGQCLSLEPTHTHAEWGGGLSVTAASESGGRGNP